MEKAAKRWKVVQVKGSRLNSSQHVWCMNVIETAMLRRLSVAYLLS